MKTRLVGIAVVILLCLFAVSLASAQSLWDVKKARTSKLDISDLWMASENVGWIITGDNKIYKTTDGCVSFTEQTNPSIKTLSKVYARSTTTAYIFGANALTLRTTDGGSTWNEITLPIPDSLGFVSVYFLDDNNGWTGWYKSEYHACVLRTTDGGGSWSYNGMIDSLKQNAGVGWGYIGRPWVVFWTADSGAVAVGTGTSGCAGYYTVNGGQTWSAATVSAGTPQKFRSSDDIVRTGPTSARWFALRGAILRTTNRGVTWDSTSGSGSTAVWWNRYNTYPAIRDIDYVNDTVSYFSVNATLGNGWNQIGRTLSGWNSFDSSQYVYTTPGTAATIMAWPSVEIGYIILRGSTGDNFIMKTTDRGTTWAPVDPNAWPPMEFARLWIADLDTNIFAIGPNSAPARSTDGGNTWALPSAQNRATPPLLPYINSTDINDVDGRAGVLIGSTGWTWQDRSTDNGLSWGSVTCPGTSLTNYSIAFADNNIAVAGGGSGKMSRTTNAGATWTSLTTIARLGFIYGIEFTSTTNGCLVGNKGVIYGTTDAGATWTYRDSIYATSYYDIKFVNSNLGYVVGYRGYLGKTTDGGTNWDLVDSLGYDSGTSTYGPTCYKIEFKDEQEGWIGAASGIVYHTYDGGLTWTKEPAITTALGDMPTVEDLKYSSGSCNLFASGNYGFIGRYKSNAPTVAKEYSNTLMIPVNTGYTLTFKVIANDVDKFDVLDMTKTGKGSLTYVPGVSPDTGTYSWTPVKADSVPTSNVVNFQATDCWGSSGEVNQTVNVFMHGDVNHDQKISVADAVFLVNYLFKGGPPPWLKMTGDANADTPDGSCNLPKVTVADVVYLVNYLFKGGPEPKIKATCLPILL
jgi:photosystem II stability/assembly factor-like uncharacterized protein